MGKKVSDPGAAAAGARRREVVRCAVAETLAKPPDAVFDGFRKRAGRDADGPDGAMSGRRRRMGSIGHVAAVGTHPRRRRSRRRSGEARSPRRRRKPRGGARRRRDRAHVKRRRGHEVPPPEP